MRMPKPPVHIAKAGLRALKTVALSDGMFKDIERRMLAAMQKHIAHTDFVLDDLELIGSEELASIVQGPYGDRIVHACVLVALCDGDVSVEERLTVDEYARALGVNDKTVGALHRFADGQFKLLRIDLLRRFVAVDRVKLTVREHGLGSIWEVVSAQLRGGKNQTMLDRYLAMAELPKGTLGRAYHDFMIAKGLPLPGQHGSEAEVIAFHDCMHVLSGYDVTPVEESQIAAFHAGMRNDDMMGMLLFSMAQFHLGVAITPVSEGLVGHLDPDLLFRAFMRGGQVSCDMAKDWDHTLDWERPVAEIRTQYNIVPR